MFLKQVRQHNTGNTGNEGSSLVLALVVVAFVSIIGMTILTMAVSGLKMKSMDALSKKSFYNADMAVDEIYNGLGDAAYEQLKSSYIYTVENILYTDGTDVAMVTNEQANAAMRKYFYKNVCEKLLGAYGLSDALALEIENALEVPAAVTYITTVSSDDVRTLLSSYLTPELSSDVTIRFNEDAVKHTVCINKALDDAGNWSVTSVSFNDVTVEYVNSANEYFSRITVDFHVKFPENREINIVNDNFGGLLSFKDYAFVTDGTVTDQVSVNISGGVYGKTGITVSPYSQMNVSDGNMVTQDRIYVYGKGSLIFDKGKIWTTNIEVQDGTFILQADAGAYVKDDLTLSANSDAEEAAGNKAVNKVTLNGDYYGYSTAGYGVGTDGSHDNSSAIIINSENSRLSLDAVKTLMLGGYGWFEYDREDSTKANYRTGESIAIKGDQIAYVLLDEWGGVVPDYFFAKSLLNPVSGTLIGFDAAGNGGLGSRVYYFNFTSGANVARYFKALFDDDEFTALCSEQNSGAGLAGADYTKALQDRERIKARVMDNYGTYLADGSSIRINGNAMVYAPGITFATHFIDSTDSDGNYRNFSTIKVAQIYNNSCIRYDIIGSLLIEQGDDWQDDGSWTGNYEGKTLSYGYMKYSHVIQSGEIGSGAYANIIKADISEDLYYYVDEDKDGFADTAHDYFVYVCGGNVALSNLCDTTGLNRGIIISNGTVYADREFTGSILAKNGIVITGGNYRADSALVEEIMENIPGIEGYFTGNATDIYGGHSVYGLIVADSEETEPAGELNGLKASDCIDLKNYRKGGADE